MRETGGEEVKVGGSKGRCWRRGREEIDLVERRGQ